MPTVQAKTLIAQGETAVTKAITDIEKEFSLAQAKAISAKAEIVAELKNYSATHMAEVTKAQSLITRAVGEVETVAQTIPPAATLAASNTGNIGAKLSVFFSAIGWKGAGLIVCGVVILHYLVHKI